MMSSKVKNQSGEVRQERIREYYNRTCNRHSNKRIYPNKIGNKTTQQKDINWSNRILGKDALTQINVNIRIQDFKPKDKL